MKTRLIIAALLVAGLFSCEKQKLENLEIRTGIVTSDCLPSDDFLLDNESVTYKMTSSCSTTEYNVGDAINSEDWDDILQLFDWSEFKSIKTSADDFPAGEAYNFIEVKYGSQKHTVYFLDTDDESIDSISLLAEKLIAMKSGYYTIGLISFILN